MKSHFKIIDEKISNFIIGKNISVSEKPHSDWLIFDWRQLTWRENEIKFLMEIYPNFNKNDEIESWTFYCAAYYDINNSRYYLNKQLKSKCSLNEIQVEFEELLNTGYNYLKSIKKEMIPKVVDLKDN